MVLPRGMSCVRGGCQRLVSHRLTGAERKAPAYPRRALGDGWHTFRHTYHSWLDDTGASIGNQQKLMRHAHAQVATTMNVYGNALMESKRGLNTGLVSKILRSPSDDGNLAPDEKSPTENRWLLLRLGLSGVGGFAKWLRG